MLKSPFVKVIAGIANTDWTAVQPVVAAAEAARQTNAVVALDVAATADIVTQARALFGGTLFASSVVPAELADAVRLGADVAELGNYDALYARGEFYTAAQVRDLAEQTIAAVKAVDADTKISVTVPGHLDKASQQALAADLEALGVDYLQTEGAARLLSTTQAVAELTGDEKAELALTNTRVLAQATRLPIIAASGIGAHNAAEMIAAGADGVGVGSLVRADADMSAAIVAIAAAMAQPALALAV